VGSPSAPKSPACSIRRWKAVLATPSGGAIFPAQAGCSASCSSRLRRVRSTRSSTSLACSASARRGAASRAWPYHSTAPASARRRHGRRADRRCACTSASRTSTTSSAISNAVSLRSRRRGEAAGSAQLLARVLINAQMSGFGGEAEILCSTRALPVLTQMYGPAVRCKKTSPSGGYAVLHQCIRPLLGAFCAPGHHGYQRACDLISVQASMGHLGHQCSHAPGRPILHLGFILSQTSAGKMFRRLALNDQAT